MTYLESCQLVKVEGDKRAILGGFVEELVVQGFQKKKPNVLPSDNFTSLHFKKSISLLIFGIV